MKKVALCFLISYNHILNKEHIWREWIDANSDIINVYFHYDDFVKIKSPWIKKHAMPQDHLVKTTYYHVVPAYFSLMGFAYNHSRENQWFIMLTESCVPIISPERFRRLFFENSTYSIINWCKPWWNIDFHRRANLKYIKKEYHWANDPWFLLKREDVQRCLEYRRYNNRLYQIICNGAIANESIFAIILYSYNQLKAAKQAVTHAADWNRMSSPTSPHLFRDGTPEDIRFIDTFLGENKYVMFLRKVHPDFPDDVLNKYIKTILPEDMTRNNIGWSDYVLFAILTVTFFAPLILSLIYVSIYAFL